MNTFSQVWVFSDTPSRLPELMNGAQALANQINTFVLNDADGAQAIQLGANHVWKLNGKPDDRMIEDYAGVMADTIRQHGADGLVPERGVVADEVALVQHARVEAHREERRAVRPRRAQRRVADQQHHALLRLLRLFQRRQHALHVLGGGRGTASTDDLSMLFTRRSAAGPRGRSGPARSSS